MRLRSEMSSATAVPVLGQPTGSCRQLTKATNTSRTGLKAVLPLLVINNEPQSTEGIRRVKGTCSSR
jgi:hypothetical protein